MRSRISRRHCSARTAAAVAALLVVGAIARADDETCPGRLEKQLAPGFSVGSPVVFVNEMNDHTCRPLRLRGRLVRWAWRLHADAATQYLFECFPFSEKPDFHLDPGERHGSADDRPSEVIVTGAGTRVAAVAAPGWNMLSNPSFSGYRMAYWSSEGDSWYGSVFDLRTRKVLARQLVLTGEIGTDDPGYFERPDWVCSGTHAVFVPHEPAQPVVLRVPEPSSPSAANASAPPPSQPGEQR
jgi:hypothetical protein